MNTEVEVFDAPLDVEALFRDWHRRLSRFDPASELSSLNGSAGRWFQASPLLYNVVERALHWAHESELFDPTILDALERAGYDRSFELVANRSPVSLAPRRKTLGQNGVQLRNGHIFLPEGIRLDLGGIAKGMAVDASLQPHAVGMVNAGGDLYAKGRQYLVGVENPFDPDQDLVTLAVRDRGVATSSTWKRRWSERAHHLIDPRTGLPSCTDVIASTVVASSAEEAEVAAKAALLEGLDAGHARLEARGLAGLLIGRHGTLLAAANFRDYVVR